MMEQQKETEELPRTMTTRSPESSFKGDFRRLIQEESLKNKENHEISDYASGFVLKDGRGMDEACCVSCLQSPRFEAQSPVSKKKENKTKMYKTKNKLIKYISQQMKYFHCQNIKEHDLIQNFHIINIEKIK